MKLAIFAPNVLPVPAVCGGAVEELITYFIEENEISHAYDIEVYTIDNPKLKNINYKYTKLIKLPNNYEKQLPLTYKILNKLRVHIFHGGPVTPFSQYIVSKYKRNYYDIVLVEDNKFIYESLMKKISNERVYFHMHNDFTLPDSKAKAISRLLHSKDLYIIKKIISRSQKIITVSNYLKNKLSYVGAKNVVTIYNCVDGNQLKPVNRENYLTKYSFKKKDFVFGYIGRFDPGKGLDKILLALKKIPMHYNVKCLIVGKNWLGSTKENKFIEQLKNISQGQEGRIKFTGYVEHNEIQNVYSIIDCLIIPTQIEEAFGVVALEAMKMGIPIISSDSGALPEVIGKENGIIINRGNDFVIHLAQAMTKMVIDKGLRKKLGENSKKRGDFFVSDKSVYFEEMKKCIN